MEQRKRIYLCLAHMSENGMEQKYIKDAFDQNWVVPLGPNVNGFEADLEAFVGQNKHIVALASGTAAVHLGLLCCGVGRGDEVMTQSFTFCASSHPITYLGAQPVFVDSEPDTWNMDPVLLEEAILDRIRKTGRIPRAIMPVSLYGMPYCVDQILRELSRTPPGHLRPIRRAQLQWQQDDYHLGRRSPDLPLGKGGRPREVVCHTGTRGLPILSARGHRI